MDGNIFNSQGVRVAIVRGPAIFDIKAKKLYDLRGINIYKLSGELVGHLANAHSADKQWRCAGTSRHLRFALLRGRRRMARRLGGFWRWRPFTMGRPAPRRRRLAA